MARHCQAYVCCGDPRGLSMSISDTDLRALKTQHRPSGGSASGLDPSPGVQVQFYVQLDKE